MSLSLLQNGSTFTLKTKKFINGSDVDLTGLRAEVSLPAGIIISSVTDDDSTSISFVGNQIEPITVGANSEDKLYITFEVTDITLVKCPLSMEFFLYNSSDCIINNASDVLHYDCASCDAVKECETVTRVVNNGDNTYSYFNEAGEEFLIDINEIDLDVNNVVVNGCEIVFTTENGQQTIVNICDIIASQADSSVVSVNSGKVIAIHTSNGGIVTDIEETVTTVTNNGDGTYTYTNENGVNILVDTLQHFSYIQSPNINQPAGPADPNKPAVNTDPATGQKSMWNPSTSQWENIVTPIISSDNTVVISGDGSVVNPWDLSVPVSSDPDNMLSLGSDDKHYLNCQTVHDEIVSAPLDCTPLN